jgi:mono/diheme cytochrome c family protein
MRPIKVRISRGLLLAPAAAAFFTLTAIATVGAESPSPSPSGSTAASGATTQVGDPNKGATLYAQDCTVCHGASLEGGIGAVLNPIEKLPGVSNPLDPAYLIATITNGRTDGGRVMPAKGGHPELTDQDVKDLAAFIIQQNRQGVGSAPLPAGELAKRTILWVSLAIIAMGFITYLLSAYNMRWIARRAAARRK